MRIESGFVYFVRCCDFVKIGFAKWPEYRMIFLRVGSPFEMTLIAQIPGSYGKERQIHHQLHKHRHRGEWFRWHPDIEALIEHELQPPENASAATGAAA